MLVVKRKKTNYFQFLYNSYRPVINLKEFAIVNEVIKCLRCKTLKYIKAYPYLHPN